MKQINFLLLFLLFIFTNSVFAELSDQKKRELIESLAKPLEKPQTFYHWHTDITFLQRLVKDGKMTSRSYEYLIASQHDQGAAGLGVGESISDTFHFSSKSMEFDGEKFFGYDDAILVEVTLDKGYPVLDLSDPEIKMELEQRGISVDEAAHLNPKVAVTGQPNRANDSIWVLKKQQGVKFKAFTSEGKSLKELSEAYYEIMKSSVDAKLRSNFKGQPEYFFKNAITKHILEAAKKDSTVWETSLVDILEEKYGREYVIRAVNRHMASRPPVQTFDEGLNILRGTSQYLSTDETEKIARQTKRFPTPSFSSLIDFLESAGKHLSKADIKKAVEEVPIRSMAEGLVVLKSENKYLSGDDIKSIIVDKIPIASIKQGFVLLAQFLIDRNTATLSDLLSSSDKLKVIEKMVNAPITSVDEAIQLLSKLNLRQLSDVDRYKVVENTPFKSVDEAIKFFEKFDDYYIYDNNLIKKTVAKVIENTPIESVDDGIKFLESVDKRILSAANRSKVVDATLPFVESEEQLARFKPYLSNSVYERKLSKFKNNQKRLAREQTGTKSTPKNNTNDNDERVKCLKKWLTKS